MEIHKNNITKTASADMAMGTVVKLDASDASKVAACSATGTIQIGTALNPAYADGNLIEIAHRAPTESAA